MRNILLLILWIGLRHAFCDLRCPSDVDGIGKCPSTTSVPSAPEDAVENAQPLYPNHVDSMDPVELRRLLSLESARAERAIKRAKLSDEIAERAIETAERAIETAKRHAGGYFLQLGNLSTEFQQFPNTSYQKYVQNFDRSEFYKFLPDNIIRPPAYKAHRSQPTRLPVSYTHLTLPTKRIV